MTQIRDIDKTYRTRLLSELRLVPYIPGNKKISDKGLQMAMTVNDNLQSLGLTLTPADIGNLAVSESMTNLFDAVKECVGRVKAAPMYPNFPKQVMAIDQAVFRMHQMVHYFSTYGIMTLTGEEVTRGWLPDVKSSKKTKKDTTLLSATRVELIDVRKVYEEPVRRILAKRERMTEKETFIVKHAIGRIDPEALSSMSIPFKENLPIVFQAIFEADQQRDSAIELLHAICKHTGDVLRCADCVLTKNSYHLTTSQKKTIVLLLETYPTADFKANLVLSGKKAKRANLIVQYLDYNKYSRSDAHKKIVADFRSDSLRSWESRVKAMIASGSDDTLSFIAERPGMLLRMTGWLIREGFDPSDIEKVLVAKAGSLSTQTLANILTVFGQQMQ